MVPPNIPSNLPNLVAPFLPAGQRPVGQESPESRKSTFKPVEQLSETAHTQVQLNEHTDDQPGHHRHGQDGPDEQKNAEVPEQGQEPQPELELEATQRNAVNQDSVQLYSPTRHGRGQYPPAPRGCLLDDTV